jgi:hypothetical protein
MPRKLFIEGLTGFILGTLLIFAVPTLIGRAIAIFASAAAVLDPLYASSRIGISWQALGSLLWCSLYSEWRSLRSSASSRHSSENASYRSRSIFLRPPPAWALRLGSSRVPADPAFRLRHHIQQKHLRVHYTNFSPGRTADRPDLQWERPPPGRCETKDHQIKL